MNVSRDKTKMEMPRGFALVATILLMVLLAIITVGTLSLSVVTLRTSNQDSTQSMARANARMALMIAIGELQKQLGPDQRISANAEILDKPSYVVTQKHWMGSWDAWIAGTKPANVNPNYPSEDSHHQTLGNQADNSMRPTYADKNAHFRSWLVSLNPESMDDLSKVTENFTTNLTPSITDNTITLASEGSLGTGVATDEMITVPLLSRVDQKGKVSGRYGFWVGDENQKARLMHDTYQGATLSSAEKIYRRQAPGSTGTKVAAGLGTITDEDEVSRVASLGSLDLLTGAADHSYNKNFHAATIHSRGVLADVREGGLKRDLSTVLERTISTSDTGSEFMLYEFDDPRFPNRSNSRVPIQDLAAYYQLYDHDPNWSRNKRGGVSYGTTPPTSPLLNSIQVTTPNYDGGSASRTKFQGEYTGLYTQPVIAKVQFLMAIGAKEITLAERTFIAGRVAASPTILKPMRATDTHKLLLGIMPVITLWNPNNVPMVMNQSQILRLSHPPITMRWKKYRDDGTEKEMYYFNLNYAMSGGQDDGLGEWYLPYTILYRFAKTNPIVFEPGEVKMFSAPPSAGGTLKQLTDASNFGRTITDPVNTWDPNSIYIVENSSPMGGWQAWKQSSDVYDFNMTSNPNEWRSSMVFSPLDRITLEIRPETTDGWVNGISDGRRVSLTNEVFGAGFNLSMTDEGFFGGLDGWGNPRTYDNFRNFQMLSRHGGLWIHRNTITPLEKQMVAFNQQMLNPGFPGGTGVIAFKSRLNAIPCGEIINASAAGDAIGLMDFSLSYGCEAGSNSLGGSSAGRRIASRPFLHSGLNAGPLMDQADTASLYDYGWDWQINPINNIEDSVVQGESATGRGFFGGGYTIEAGTTHVVQREIPVLPPISIASLSHAHLGGFSLARNNNVGQNPATDNYSVSFWDTNDTTNRIRFPKGVDFQQTTATGQGGLAPHVLQAIGNSYAHPNIPADKAFITKPRQLDGQESAVNAPFVDHSYLANKALWDEFYFSSITPQPSSVALYGGAGRTVQQVTTDFLSKDILKNVPLPNRRLIAYNSNLDSSKLSNLLTQYSSYNNGFADKISSYQMVDGSFNINSTSVEAWKILFSSLKGKPNTYLQGGVTPSESSPANTVVSYGSLPAAEPIASGSINGPNLPAEQWKGGRELSDDEIEKLAVAMVEQVKLRGPFLSLSEFINRRLDGSNVEFALKGTLQAALDDPDVTINAQFRENDRILDNETASITFPFDAAANGPVAYGSAAYVDQADILRGLAAQLTPRGDTFIIRTYGDYIGKNGEVLARAWCEAVVQRVPEYLDPADEAHIKHSILTSETNKIFGRKIIIVGFRWLNDKEI